MLAEGGDLSTGTLAKRADVSAPTAYKALVALAQRGRLEHIGAGRGSRFRPVPTLLDQVTERRAGLSESDVWSRFAALPRIKTLKPNVQTILHHAVTEMVNNAIDHSAGKTVRATMFETNDAVGFEVIDDGIGVFENVMSKFGLKTPFESIAELQKGKVTSQPEAHAGEGIFFTSKMADHMTIESHATRWIVDTANQDQAVALAAPATDGTRVRFQIGRDAQRTVEDVYRPFTDGDLAFTKTKTSIRLFRQGREIVSRSEAKRLLNGLEKFSEVELDFSGIEGIGQGFADEVFRIWQREHPGTSLVPSHTNSAVRFMIERARASSSASQAIRPATVSVSVVTDSTGDVAGVSNGPRTTSTT
jgi:anti-sigma regulatory factor (Ser/Thr protein kinase)